MTRRTVCMSSECGNPCSRLQVGRAIGSKIGCKWPTRWPLVSPPLRPRPYRASIPGLRTMSSAASPPTRPSAPGQASSESWPKGALRPPRTRRQRLPPVRVAALHPLGCASTSFPEQEPHSAQSPRRPRPPLALRLPNRSYTVLHTPTKTDARR